MAKVCPMKGCKEKEGMCIHDKMMMWMVIIVAVVVLAKVFGWF